MYLQCRFFIAQTLFDRSIRQDIRRREIRLPLSTLCRSEKCVFCDLAQPDIPFTFAAKAVYAFQRLEKSVFGDLLCPYCIPAKGQHISEYDIVVCRIYPFKVLHPNISPTFLIFSQNKACQNSKNRIGDPHPVKQDHRRSEHHKQNTDGEQLSNAPFPLCIPGEKGKHR